MMSTTINSKTAKMLLFGTSLANVAMLLQGCGGGGDDSSNEDAKKGPPQVVLNKDDCAAKCEHDALYGRWHAAKFAHLCLDESVNKVFCECSSSQATPDGCTAHDGGSSLAAISDSNFRGSQQQTLIRDDDQGGDLSTGDDALFTAPSMDGTVMVDISAGAQVFTGSASTAQARYTETDTVNNFCDKAGLKRMHGKTVSEDDAADVARDLESKILGDVARELETNNVDKMAKEIFTFYVCARWVPDDVFWELARQELAAQIANQVLEGDALDLAIADMYRKYRFVPMLCSKNLEVFAEKDDDDNTYFRKFKHATQELAEWLKSAASRPVNAELAKVDATFCEGKPMVSCHKDASYDGIRKFFGYSTEVDKKKSLADGFKAFTNLETPGFQDDLKVWKQKFPYHSFIGKPDEWDAKNQDSPHAGQRFVICFGKRVASEMHRRPSGAHILTDQNNIGCHGWYEAAVAGQQLTRMVELWKPPTCQLAEMTYVMKKEIMAKFQEMNERLFDSLPSQINDELEAEDRDQKDFDWESELPKPFEQGHFTAGSRTFVDDMRVGALAELCLSIDKFVQKPSNSDERKRVCGDGDVVKKDVYGTVHVVSGKLLIKWDTLEQEYEVNAADLQILPHGWQQRKGWHHHVRDLVAGVNKISDKAMALFNSLFAKKQQNLANLMAGSVSKWVVCPIKSEASKSEMEALDAQLGVEDEAFKDFQMEAYKSWTGFKKKIPGQECSITPAEVLTNAKGFQGVLGCEINELHANHVEQYTKDDRTKEKEEFICPIRPPLSAPEQLEILHEKSGMCLLHMTGSQRQQSVWHYQGEFPARRQNDRKANVPQREFELVKLIKVPGGDIKTEVSYGRYCSLHELKTNARFCDLPEVHNDYSTAEEYAALLTKSIASVAVKLFGGKESTMAPLSITASALSESVGRYQDKLKKKTTVEKVKEGAKKTAIWVGENTWDSLRGAGRLLKSSALAVKNKVFDELRGKGRVRKGYEEQHFGSEKSGELLHALSFQRSIGKSNTTSNSKERFQRYVMVHPCPDFDPTRSFAMKTRWSEIVLRLVKETNTVHSFRSSGTRPLDSNMLSVQIRGNAARFRLPRSQSGDSVTHVPTVSMLWEQARDATFTCEKDGRSCVPAGFCHYVSEGLFSSDHCDANNGAGSSSWWPVASDPVLRSLVAPDSTSGLFELDGTNLYGFKMELHCASKFEFGSSGPPTTKQPLSLEKCLKQGVLSNAQLRSKEPWKLYFPDEVVVVAIFSEIAENRYFAMPDIHADDSKALNSGPATQDLDYFKHLLGKDKQPLGHKSSDTNRFVGMRSGKGFPRATLSEVVLRPEDVLEALGMIEESYGR